MPKEIEMDSKQTHYQKPLSLWTDTGKRKRLIREKIIQRK
jgi:hypothetical protein